MKIEVERIVPNHLDPDWEFIDAEVAFSEEDPSNRLVALINVQIKKDPSMTLPQIIDAAIDQARNVLRSCASSHCDGDSK